MGNGRNGSRGFRDIRVGTPHPNGMSPPRALGGVVVVVVAVVCSRDRILH